MVSVVPFMFFLSRKQQGQQTRCCVAGDFLSEILLPGEDVERLGGDVGLG